MSVLRAPRGTGIYPSRPTACSSLSDGPCAPTPHYTVASSCSALRRNGLDDTLHDLLYLAQHGPGIDDLISYLGLETYASKTRAKIQLAVLLKKNFDSNVEDNKLL